MAEDHSLPGWPKKKLVKDVRRQLSHYGIRPARPSLWRATWSWAAAIARSYYHDHWPLPSEIATQYVLLLLAEMKSRSMWKLPHRAKDFIPADVAAMLTGPHMEVLFAMAVCPRTRRGVPRLSAVSDQQKVHIATRPVSAKNSEASGRKHENN